MNHDEGLNRGSLWSIWFISSQIHKYNYIHIVELQQKLEEAGNHKMLELDDFIADIDWESTSSDEEIHKKEMKTVKGSF